MIPIALRWFVMSRVGLFEILVQPPIPWVRDGEPNFGAQPPRFLQHLGLYAYRRTFLLQLAQTPPGSLEQLEKLEQLRILSLGSLIKVGIVREAAIGVDTFADYERFVRTYRAAPRVVSRRLMKTPLSERLVLGRRFTL